MPSVLKGIFAASATMLPHSQVSWPAQASFRDCCGTLRQEEWRGEVEQVSWSPRAFLYKKFLSEEECDHLINHVRKPGATPSAEECRAG